MKTIHLALAVVFAFLLLVTSRVSQAQTSTSKAKLSGVVTDPSGSGVGGVRVTAQPADASGTPAAEATTNAEGAYTLELGAGKYRVRFAKETFGAKEEVAELAGGESRTENMRLELAPLSASVLVTGHAEPIDGDESPAPSSILTREQMDQRQNINVSGLIGTQPGVTVAQTGPIGGLTSVFLDGGNSTYTKVLIDGTPMNQPGGTVNLANLTLDNVDKVEIVHGAESTLYGSDAMSGAIQVLSHRGSTRIPAVMLFGEGGELSSGRGGGQVSGLLGKFDYSAAGSYLGTAGQGVNDSFINRSMAANTGYSFSDTNQLRLTVRSNSSWSGVPGPTLVLPPSEGQNDALQVLTANLGWNFTTGEHWQHQIAGTEMRTVDSNYIPQYSSTPYVDQFNVAGLNAQSSYFFAKGLVAAGYHYEVENGYPSSIAGGTHAQRINQAGFLDGRWFPVSRVTLSAGFRVESNATFGIRTVPRAGIAVLVRQGDTQGFWGKTTARFSYGEGIKEPSLAQSFGTDPCYPGNPNLKPEESQTINATVDQYFSADRLRVSLSYFTNRYENIISYAPDPENPYCGTYFNTDLAKAHGINLSSELRIKRWLSVDGYYTYDPTQVVKSENPFEDPALVPGNRLLRRPVNSGSVIVNIFYRRVNWNFIGYFSGTRTDTNFMDPAQTNNPGYARFDMAASYNVTHGLAFTARVINLFNKQYQDALGYPTLGQTYYFGGRYTFSGRN